MKSLVINFLITSLLTICLSSCLCIKDSDLIGCYTSPFGGDIMPHGIRNPIDMLVLHKDYSFSKYLSDGIDCDDYKLRKYPIQGTWRREGLMIYSTGYVNQNSKGWVEESRDSSLHSLSRNEIKVYIHRNWDKQIDTTFHEIYIENPSTKNCDEYKLVSGVTIINKTTDKIDLFKNVIISNYWDFSDIQYNLRDSLSNRLDVYVTPKANYRPSARYILLGKKIALYSDRIGWYFSRYFKLCTYKKEK